MRAWCMASDHIACPIGTGIEITVHDPVQSFLAEYPDGDRKRTRPTSPTSAPASSPLGKSREGSNESHVFDAFSAPLAAATMSYAMNRSSAQVAMLRSVGSLKTPCPERFHLQ